MDNVFGDIICLNGGIHANKCIINWLIETVLSEQFRPVVCLLRKGHALGFTLFIYLFFFFENNAR